MARRAVSAGEQAERALAWESRREVREDWITECAFAVLDGLQDGSVRLSPASRVVHLAAFVVGQVLLGPLRYRRPGGDWHGFNVSRFCAGAGVRAPGSGARVASVSAVEGLAHDAAFQRLGNWVVEQDPAKRGRRRSRKESDS